MTNTKAYDAKTSKEQSPMEATPNPQVSELVGSSEWNYLNTQGEDRPPPPPYHEHESLPQQGQMPSQSSHYTSTVSTVNTDMSNIENTQSASRQRLTQLIAIPATSKKLGSPFMRAYPTILNDHGISKEVFLPWIDKLNRVAVSNPPLQILDLAGTVVGFVPLHEAQIVGASINVAALIGKYAISKGRTEMQLRSGNKELFGPQGLKVEIAKTKVVAKLAGIDVLDEKGELRKDVPFLKAFGEVTDEDEGELEDEDTDSDEFFDDEDDSHSETSDSSESESDEVEAEGKNPKLSRFSTKRISLQQRRLEAVQEHIAHLEYENLTKPSTSTNPLSKWSQHNSETQRTKEENRLTRKRAKQHHRREKLETKPTRKFDRRMSKLDRKMEKINLDHEADQNDSKRDKRMAKLERKREKAKSRYEKRENVKGEKMVKRDREEKVVRKIVWLIIRDRDADSGPGENPDVES